MEGLYRNEYRGSSQESLRGSERNISIRWESNERV